MYTIYTGWYGLRADLGRAVDQKAWGVARGRRGPGLPNLWCDWRWILEHRGIAKGSKGAGDVQVAGDWWTWWTGYTKSRMVSQQIHKFNKWPRYCLQFLKACFQTLWGFGHFFRRRSQKDLRGPGQKQGLNSKSWVPGSCLDVPGGWLKLIATRPNL